MITHPITADDVRRIYDAEIARLQAVHAKTPQDQPIPLLAWRSTRTLVYEQIHQVHAPPPEPPETIKALGRAREALSTAIIGEQPDSEIDSLREAASVAQKAAEPDLEHQHEAVEKPHNKAIWREVDRLVAAAGLTPEGRN